jgi:ATP-dependent helicase/nuclease subunit B
MYFMQYGLKAKERKRAGFEAPELGTFVHFVLENVSAEARELGGFKNLTKGRFAALQTSTRRFISADFSAGMS